MDNLELARISADIQSAAMPDTCNILSVTRIDDGYGGRVETWGTVTSVPCRMDSKDGNLTMAGGALQSFSGVMFTLPGTVTITSKNRIEHPSGLYNVMDYDTGKSWQATVRVKAELVI
jgi:head-tail adaptor